MTKCANCGEKIMVFSPAGPWVHADGYSIECECPLYAEAEPHSEETEDYVSFEYEPNWSILKGQ